MARDMLIGDPPRWFAAARRTWLPWSIAGLSLLLYALTVALFLLTRSVQTTSNWGSSGIAELLVFLPFLAFPVVGALIASRHPGNPIGWICLTSGVLWMLAITGGFYEQLSLAAIGSVTNSLWVPAVGLLGIYLPLLFPNGRLPSERWRLLAWLAGAVILSVSVAAIIEPGPMPDLGGVPNPFGLEGRLPGMLGYAIVLLPLCMLTSAFSLILRFRRSGSEVRQQIKWIAFAASVVGLLYLVTLFSTYVFTPDSSWFAGQLPWIGFLQNAVLLSYAGVPVAIGIAVLKYRLYDLDLVVNRALVYGLLTASVVAIYVLVVGYLGALFRTGGNLFVSLVATGLVAVLFQPLRERLQRAVNRLMHGERDEPYAVVSRLGQRLEATLSPDAVLDTITQTVREALKLSYVAVALEKADGAPAEIAASAGKQVEEPLRLPLAYQNEPVGELLIGSRSPGEGFSAADRRLLDALARQAGIAAHAVRLTADLQRSRERLVTAREEERRRLRRDLHDGLGAQLAGLNIQTGALRRSIRRDPAAAEELTAELKTELQLAIADIRRLVYDLRPPALDDLGLVTALRQLAERFGAENKDLRVTVEASEEAGLPPFPAAVEVALYRVAQEALTNVVRHAQARTCVVRLSMDDGANLEVVDDGVGILSGRTAGVGLSSMRERAAELGGVCVVEPVPEGGTRVVLSLPLPAKEG